MRKTYAYNSIIFGFLFGLLVGMTTKSVVLGILTGLGVSVVGFIVIRLIENAIHKGVEKAADKISEAHQRRKEQKAIENGTYQKTVTTQMPVRTAPATAKPAAKRSFCMHCGAEQDGVSRCCPVCGKPVE